jgi:hypothetical protein
MVTVSKLTDFIRSFKYGGAGVLALSGANEVSCAKRKAT